MPYIEKGSREEIDVSIDIIANDMVANSDSSTLAGICNYTLTRTLLIAFQRMSNLERGTKKLNYRAYNEILGVLSCMTQEIYRRQAALYEDEKIIENGDINWTDKK